MHEAVSSRRARAGPARGLRRRAQGPGGSSAAVLQLAKAGIEQLAKELPQEKFNPRPREEEQQDERNLFDRVKDMFG